MEKDTKFLSKVVQINDGEIKDHLGHLVKDTVEDMLNNMLDAEADAMCQAQRYQRSPDRIDTRAGYYQRKYHTKSGEVTVKMPKLRRQTFESAIIERYKRRESSIEESLIEMYLAGVSVRRVEDITQALWGTRVSSGTVSNLNKKVYKHIEEWRNRPIEGEFPYVYLDGIVLKRSWAGEVKNVSVLVAIGVGEDGYRRVLGVQEGHKEDISGWSSFLSHLKKRGLKGVKLVISDACMGLVESVSDYYPDADWQRCVVHFYRNIFSHVPSGKVKQVAVMLKAIHAQESLSAAKDKVQKIVNELHEMKLRKASEMLGEHFLSTLTYYNYPQPHWIRLKTNNPMERIMREIRRRTRVVGAFPDGNSALMLVAARLRHIAGTNWGNRRYINMELLKKQKLEQDLIA